MHLLSPFSLTFLFRPDSFADDLQLLGCPSGIPPDLWLRVREEQMVGQRLLYFNE